MAALQASAADDQLHSVVNDVPRAALNYMLNCQGCHLPLGQGVQDEVPDLRAQVGRFIGVRGGREFLVQVPGSANAALPDEALADLLNWLLITMSSDELPDPWQPYTAEEVARLRLNPLREVSKVRASLVAQMPTR